MAKSFEDSVYGIRGTLQEASRIEYLSRDSNRYSVHLRGWKCRTMGELFDEFAASFQFRTYFGYNLDALAECLGDFFFDDLQYQAERTGLDIVIWHANSVLDMGEGTQGRLDLEKLVSIFRNAMDEIRSPTGFVVGREQISRDVSLYLHFEDEAAALDVTRWNAAGCLPIRFVSLDPNE